MILICSCKQLRKFLIVLSPDDDKGNGAGKYWVGIWINLFRNLNSRIICKCLLHFSSNGQFNDCNISVILSQWFFLHGLFSTSLAAQSCIISSLWMDVCWYGSHIVEQYSIDGKTICLQACSLRWGGQWWRFLRRNPSRQFALLQIECTYVWGPW